MEFISPTLFLHWFPHELWNIGFQVHLEVCHVLQCALGSLYSTDIVNSANPDATLVDDSLCSDFQALFTSSCPLSDTAS